MRGEVASRLALDTWNGTPRGARPGNRISRRRHETMSTGQPRSVGTYIYCVTYARPFQGNGTAFQARGIAGLPARIVQQGDLAAVVSDSLTDQYDVTRDNVTAHEGVVEQAMQQADILPVSFGTVAGSDRDVQERLLRRESAELHRQLERVKNRVEMGVKALWEQNALFAEIVAEDSRIQTLRDQIVGTTPEQTYDIRLQLGELTNAAIERKRERDASAMLNVLAPLAVESQVNKIITDMMVLNAAFLVEKHQVHAFQAKANELAQAQSGRMMVKNAGPLPPYNFVRVAVHWEEPSGAIAQ